jgi:CheY-like chemotaxis protein
MLRYITGTIPYSPGGPMRPRTILLDDDAPMLQMLTLVLQKRGHEVVAFSSPAACPLFLDASCQCPLEHPCGDILISDLNMPVMNGLDFIRLQAERGCKGKVQNKLLISAHIGQQEILRARELGCTVMRKPFKLAALLSWIAEAEERISAHRQLSAIPA